LLPRRDADAGFEQWFRAQQFRHGGFAVLAGDKLSNHEFRIGNRETPGNAPQSVSSSQFVAGATCLLGFFLCASQCWQEHRSEDGNDGDDDELLRITTTAAQFQANCFSSVVAVAVNSAAACGVKGGSSKIFGTTTAAYSRVW
jgi:hypothetical protein